jgi:hypothetical protein
VTLAIGFDYFFQASCMNNEKIEFVRRGGRTRQLEDNLAKISKTARARKPFVY